MSPLLLVALIVGCLMLGATLGILAGAMLIANQASKSFALVDAKRRAAQEALLSAAEPEDQVLRREIEASDALEAERERNFRLDGGYGRPQERSGGPTFDAPRRVNGRPCMPCEKARKAVLAARRAIFGP